MSILELALSCIDMILTIMQTGVAAQRGLTPGQGQSAVQPAGTSISWTEIASVFLVQSGMP